MSGSITALFQSAVPHLSSGHQAFTLLSRGNIAQPHSAQQLNALRALHTGFTHTTHIQLETKHLPDLSAQEILLGAAELSEIQEQ